MMPATTPLKSPEKTKKNVREDFRLEPHVCRRCFGRIVSADAGDGLREYTCSNCGFSETGSHPSVVCSCGIKLRKSTVARSKSATPQDAGVRCIENPDPRPEFPALYVACHVGA